MKALLLLLLAVIAVGFAPLAAQATTTKGTVSSITYNADGLATGFVLNKAPGTQKIRFTIGTPSERMTENLQRWKDAGTTIVITDQNGNRTIEGGDTIQE